jgi:hypothetical protein
MVTSVKPRSLAMLAKLSRRTCGVTSDSGESLKICFQWLGKLPNALSSPCPGKTYVPTPLGGVMQLFSVSIGEIEEDIVGYFVRTMGASPSSLTPATDVRKMFRFSAAAWAQLADTLSNQPWMLRIGVRLAPVDMMTVSTIAQLSHLIFTPMRHVVVPAAAPSVAPVNDLMSIPGRTAAQAPTATPKRAGKKRRPAAKTPKKRSAVIKRPTPAS